MVHLFSKYAVLPAGLLLVLVFAAALIWCGDGACLSGTSDGQCASLICSLFADHNTSTGTQAGKCSTECTCVCHMPTILGMRFDAEHHLTAENATFEFSASAPSSPPRPIYHPPKT